MKNEQASHIHEDHEFLFLTHKFLVNKTFFAKKSINVKFALL